MAPSALLFALFAIILAVSQAFPELRSAKEIYEEYQKHKQRRDEGENAVPAEPEVGEIKAFECREEGESCMGVPKCCGDLRCAWAGGFKPFTKGSCVSCVGNLGACQVDSQCCEGLQCDKEQPIQINGHCVAKRANGADCFENSQCSGWCERELFHIWGYCHA